MTDLLDEAKSLFTYTQTLRRAGRSCWLLIYF